MCSTCVWIYGIGEWEELTVPFAVTVPCLRFSEAEWFGTEACACETESDISMDLRELAAISTQRNT